MLTKDIANKECNLCCHGYQLYGAFHLNFYMLICLIESSKLENVNSAFRQILGIGKARCNSDETNETFHLNCYMLISFIKCSMLQTVDSGSRKISRIEKGIYVAIVAKF